MRTIIIRGTWTPFKVSKSPMSYYFNPKRLFRLRRSALYVPCSNLRMINKAMELGADVVIYDLEDSVATKEKENARNNVQKIFENNKQRYNCRNDVILRVNEVNSTLFYDDVKTALSTKVDGILLPKVNDANCILKLSNTIKDICLNSGNPISQTPDIWACIESPHGIQNISEICQTSISLPLTTIVMGTTDLSHALRIKMSNEDLILRTPLLYSLSRCVNAARSYNLNIFDGIHPNLSSSEEEFERIVHNGLLLGFDGKVFSPSVKEVNDAKDLLEEWGSQVGGDESSGVMVRNGRIIEGMHVKEANRIIAMNEAIIESKRNT